MKFFSYIFFRSYVNMYKTKYKDGAEARSIQFVLIYQVSILFSFLMILNKLFKITEYQHIDKRILVIIILPIVWIVWSFVEKYYRKQSKNSYEIIRHKFGKSKYNKIIPFWLIFIFPFILLFGVPFILSLFN